MIRAALAAAALLLLGAAPQLTIGPDHAPAVATWPQGDVRPVHDPVMIREGDTYHVFSTGIGAADQGIVSHRTSDDLATFHAAPAPFAKLPDWVVRAIPSATNMWAPDISYVNGRYRLYYSVSTFGSNRSAIGLATSATLDPAKWGYGWRDEGPVVQSQPGDDFNAIDPAFVAGSDGRHWLALGSFWSGIKLFALDPRTGKLLHAGESPLAIARRSVPAGAPSAIEAPYIFEHGGWYWLLASYDYCCKGVNSTYYTVVARSKRIEGPYVGRDGSSMLNGGGTVILHADLQEKERFRGPGHSAYFRDTDGTDPESYIVYHAYDKAYRGAPTLRIAPLQWDDDGWPSVSPGRAP